MMLRYTIVGLNLRRHYFVRRYTVVLNGYEAIQEALVRRAADFAGRGEIYAENHVWNVESRG